MAAAHATSTRPPIAATLGDVPEPWIRTASDRRAIELGYRWSQACVDYMLRFAGTLRNPMDIRRPYRMYDWQNDTAASLFGWRRPDGRRRFTRLNLWIPKKNAKSSFAAFLGLYDLLASRMLRPATRCVSTTGEQIAEAFDESESLLGRTDDPQLIKFSSPWLGRLQFVKHRRIIRNLHNGGIWHGMAASAKGAEGVKGSLVHFDEIHASLQVKPKLYEAMMYAGSGRLQPLILRTSTAGDDQQGLPHQLYADDKAIADGTAIDLDTLVVIHEAADRDDYSDEQLAAANPLARELPSFAAQLRSDYDEARRRPYTLDGFKRYRLNIWTKRASAWLNVNTWDACRVERIGLCELAGRKAYVGVDLSSRLDLTAACAVIPLDDGRFAFIPHAWLPADGIEERANGEMNYKASAAGGGMTLIPGREIDYQFVASWIDALAVFGLDVPMIGFDPAKASEIAKDLSGRGYDCVAVKQGWLISEPCNRFESLVETHQALHSGNAVMSWCVGNAEVLQGATGQIRLVKPKDRRKRIDPLVAAVNGLYLAMFGDKTQEIDPAAASAQIAMLTGRYAAQR